MANPIGRTTSQPLIAVADVKASSRWYQELLDATGLPPGSDHDHVYDRIYRDGNLLLQLHAWDEDGHPNLVDREAARNGHGVLIWFEVSDFDDTVGRIVKLRAEVLEDPHVNPGPRHREIWFRDPDGYVVVVASPDGEASE